MLNFSLLTQFQISMLIGCVAECLCIGVIIYAYAMTGRASFILLFISNAFSLVGTVLNGVANWPSTTIELKHTFLQITVILFFFTYVIGTVGLIKLVTTFVRLYQARGIAHPSNQTES